MKMSEQWLREWSNPKLNTAELVAEITMAGLEVDAVEAVAADFNNVVVGEIVSIAQHPDADKLRVCQVSDGNETVQVVCGAANARQGLKIPFARLGAVLPGLAIKKAKLRGVESFGMLCAAQELGMAEKSEGLLELPADAPVGQCVREYLKLDDKALEVDLTPNRGDCLSVRGMAREVSAITGARYAAPEIKAVAAAADDRVPVEIFAAQACPRYVGRVVRNVDLSVATPLWMAERLRRAGLRSIDPVVDITNYVLLELGQPMHAFDLDTLQGGVVVREAKTGEQLKLLNGQEVVLRAGTLVIADHTKPVALAGVMGGADTAVSTSTRNVLFEAAFFAPIALAGVARSYGLHTDSSHRFERGVDYSLQELAIERATGLLLDICGGVAGPINVVESSQSMPIPAEVTLRRARIESYLGFAIADDEVTAILDRLGMQVANIEGGWVVKAPSYRFDIAIEVDLLEELARVYGYNRLPTAAPQVRMAFEPKDECKPSLREFRRRLTARGYQEAITYSFVEPSLLASLAPDLEAIPVSNPISADMGVMRTSLWCGLVASARHNNARQQSRVRLFETGLRFYRQGAETVQEPMLAMLATGSRLPEGWGSGRELVDFFDVKADVEALLSLSGLTSNIEFVADAHPSLHPGQCASLMHQGERIGWIGALHPRLQREWDFSAPVYLLEVKLAALQQGKMAKFSEISRYPEVRRDLAVVIERTVPASAVEACVRESAGELLRELCLFDVYEGKAIESNRKSLALGLTIQHSSRTLNDAEINELVARVVDALQQNLDASLRT